VGLAVQRDVAQMNAQIRAQALDGASSRMLVRHALGRAGGKVRIRNQGNAHGGRHLEKFADALGSDARVAEGRPKALQLSAEA